MSAASREGTGQYMDVVIENVGGDGIGAKAIACTVACTGESPELTCSASQLSRESQAKPNIPKLGVETP